MEMIRSRNVLALGGLLAVAAVVVACGASPTIDAARLQQRIGEDAATTKMPTSNVACPSGRAAVTGDRFTCEAALVAGGTLVYEVTITSDQGSYSYSLAPGQTIDGSRVAALITADVVGSTPDLSSATVICPTSVVAPGGTASFACSIDMSGTSTPIDVTHVAGRPLSWAYSTS